MRLKSFAFSMFLLGLCPLVHATEDCNSTCKSEIDNYINAKMKVHEIPGVSVSVLKHGKVVFSAQNGVSSIERQAPVSKDDSFRLYSATKIFVNVAVFQLIENNKLSLDTYVKDYFANAPKAWSPIQIKHLLSHSSGLPNFIRFESEPALSDIKMWEKITSLQLEYDAGDRHSYNQTNYWALAKIIESVTRMKMSDYIIQNQFNGLPDHIAFSSNDAEDIPGRIVKYNFDNARGIYTRSSFDAGTRGLAGNGMSISNDRLAMWLTSFHQDELLSEKTKSTMLSPFNYRDSDYKFLHGFASYTKNEPEVYGFSGGGVSGIRCWHGDELCISVLSNGYKYYPVVNELIEEISWIFESKQANPEKKRLYSLADKAILSGSFSLKEDFAYSENILNSFGYRMLRVGKDELALTSFELAVKQYPGSWNAHDSLGETLASRGEVKRALNSYTNAFKLNKGSERLRKITNQLRQQLSEETHSLAK